MFTPWPTSLTPVNSGGDKGWVDEDGYLYLIGPKLACSFLGVSVCLKWLPKRGANPISSLLIVSSWNILSNSKYRITWRVTWNFQPTLMGYITTETFNQPYWVNNNHHPVLPTHPKRKRPIREAWRCARSLQRAYQPGWWKGCSGCRFLGQR